MADQNNNGIPPNDPTPGEGAAPPKQMPFKPLAPTPGDAKDGKTVMIRRPMTLRRPGEAAPGAPAAPESTPAGVPVPPSEMSKHKTTRVELPEIPTISAAEPDSGEFKTVKLRPMAAPIPGSSPLPGGPKPPTASQIQAAKSKTSRISLEDALGTSEDMMASGAPKTIRLKRPSELSLGATGPIPVAMATNPAAVSPVTSPQQSQTARLPTQTLSSGSLPAADDDNSPTRRKTIKIKRPSAATGIKVNVSQAEGREEGQAGEGTETDMQSLSLPAGMKPIAAIGPDTVHWAFLAAAVAALIVTLGVVWILAAQTFGPNAALTGYTALKGPDIAPPPGLTVID